MSCQGCVKQVYRLSRIPGGSKGQEVTGNCPGALRRLLTRTLRASSNPTPQGGFLRCRHTWGRTVLCRAVPGSSPDPAHCLSTTDVPRHRPPSPEGTTPWFRGSVLKKMKRKGNRYTNNQPSFLANLLKVGDSKAWLPSTCDRRDRLQGPKPSAARPLFLPLLATDQSIWPTIAPRPPEKRTRTH